MRPIIAIMILSSLLSACTSSPPLATALFDEASGKNALSRAIANDCMNVNVVRFKEDSKVTNPAVAAEVYCRFVVGVCRDEPGSEDCRKAIRAYDLKRGPSGASALFEASYRGSTGLVRQLLASGFDPNAPLAGPAWTGWNPLLIATAERHHETVKILLEAGAYPNAHNDLGRTSLMFASNYGDAVLVAILLDKGANTNIVPNDDTGWTALMVAAANGHSRVVQLLLEHGADKVLRSKSGQTALDLAVARNQSVAARILKDFETKK